MRIAAAPAKNTNRCLFPALGAGPMGRTGARCFSTAVDGRAAILDPSDEAVAAAWQRLDVAGILG